jgi:hypothetical protein
MKQFVLLLKMEINYTVGQFLSEFVIGEVHPWILQKLEV